MNENHVTEIRQALTQWLKAFNSNDIDLLTALYDPEIVFANNSKPLETGIPEVKQGLIKSFVVQPKLTFKEEQVVAVEGLGYAAGQYKMTGTNPQDGTAISGTGRVVAIFRKNDSGKWKLIFDMDNRPPDVTI